MKKFVSTVMLLNLLLINTGNSVFAATQNNSAPVNYAGYGYTHGSIPVNDNNNSSYYDSDIWRYDLNTQKPAQSYYTLDDLKNNTVKGVFPANDNSFNQ